MNERNDMTGCPDPEILGAFLDGTLKGESLRAMTEHLATCDDCLAVMEEARGSVLPEPREAEVVRPSFRRWPLALAATLIIVAGLAAVAVLLRAHSDRGGMRTLIAAAPSYRTVEPRIGGFAWAELRRLRADETAPSDPEALRLAGAAGEVLAHADEQPHAAGVAELLLAKPSRAIERLRDAVTRDPNDATAWSDLAAAYYASAAQGRRADALPDALAAADRALAIDAKHAEAHFNRALILERLGLRDAAADAWRAYLVLDETSPWADEARRHLQALTAPQSSFDPHTLENRAALDALVRAQTEGVRKWTEAEILGQWGEAMLAGDATAAAARLDLARATGASLMRANGDALLADAIAAIDREREVCVAEPSGPPASRGLVRRRLAAEAAPRRRCTSRRDAGGPSVLAAAHAAYRRGRLRYREHDLERAAAELADAADAFASAGSPMSGVARLYAASVAFDENRTDDAASELEELVRATPPRYASLAAEARHQLGRCAMREGRWGEAVAELDRAAAAFRSLRESWSLGLVEAALGDARAGLGDRAHAWEHRVAAFELLSRGPSGQRLLATIASAAWSELRDERLDSAAALQRLEIGEAQRVGNPLLVADAYRRSALLHARTGDDAAGSGDLREARAELARESNSGLRARVDAACGMAEGVLARRGDAKRSAELLTRSIDFLRAAGEHFNLAEALAERARTRRAEGASDAARDDFAAALREVEAQRGNAADSAIFDTVTPLFEEAVALLLARGEAAEAFAYAERVHARAAEPATVESVTRALPAGTALVEYVLVPDGVSAFCVTRNGFHHVAIDANRAQLVTDIRRLRETIVQRGDASSIAAKLHAQLIAPLPDLAYATSLVVVADRALQAIPWAALRDGASGPFLVERYALATAPSAGLWLRAQRREPRDGARLLLVTDDARTNLDPLERLRHEADAVAAFYPERRVLSGADATPAHFATEANECDVIHFAGHARGAAESREPALLIAGELRARDIARLRLTRPRLAVLAGCSTIDGDPASLEGMPSLARAFFDAGVPDVIGTLWAVDDAQTATLFEEFHRRVRAGASAAEALRDAQLAMIRAGGSAAHPASWAAAELLGT